MEAWVPWVAGAGGVVAGIFLGVAWAQARFRAQRRTWRAEAEEHWRGKWESARESYLESAAELRALRSTLADQRELGREALRDAQESHSRSLVELRESFRALSREVVEDSKPELVRLTEDRIEAFRQLNEIDAEARRLNIERLVDPLIEQLKDYQGRLSVQAKSQTEALAGVRENVQALTRVSEGLAAETQKFRETLRSNQARGQWGEQTLRRVVEAAGLLSWLDYSEQLGFAGGKPDMVVRLPDNRAIVIDAKSPDFSGLADLADLEPNESKLRLEAYCRRLKGLIRELSERDYPAKGVDTFGLTLLFLPAEALLDYALRADPDLLTWANERKVALTTPVSLAAILNSIAWTWRQKEQTENAEKMIEVAGELYDRLRVFVHHFEGVRKGLDAACQSYNRAVASYERSARPAARRLDELRMESDGSGLPELHSLEPELRSEPEGASD